MPGLVMTGGAEFDEALAGNAYLLLIDHKASVVKHQRQEKQQRNTHDLFHREDYTSKWIAKAIDLRLREGRRNVYYPEILDKRF
jgi:hypothetical protein